MLGFSQRCVTTSKFKLVRSYTTNGASLYPKIKVRITVILALITVGK